MGRYLSTFDKLVETLSSDEAADMLARIHGAVEEIDNKANVAATKDINILFKKRKKEKALSEEPFLIRLYLNIVAFVKSMQINEIYNDYQLKNLGKELKRNSSLYIDVKNNNYTSAFYDRLRDLRKAQLFFSGLLSTYDAEKGQFYMLLSSLVAPNLYESLMKKTDPFEVEPSKELSVSLKSNFFKSIDATFLQLTDENKASLYECAKSIEWMVRFCDLSLDKILFSFNTTTDNTFCSTVSIQPELKMLTSVLNSVKKIPDAVLQTLFLLHQQDRIASNENLEESLNDFLVDAKTALGAINDTINSIPLIQIIRYVDKDIGWTPLRIEGGEDWLVFFKHAWKSRFNDKWLEWSSEQQKRDLRIQILKMIDQDEMLDLKYKPWADFAVGARFKWEFSIRFLKSFFFTVYAEKLENFFKLISSDGKFYRRNNMVEFTDASISLKRLSQLIDDFEKMLSPEGEIGSGFAKLKTDNLIGLKFKNAFDALMRSMETNAKQLMTDTSSTLKSLYAVLTGILNGSKTGLYATLSNLRAIKGQNNPEFLDELEKCFNIVKQSLNILETLEKVDGN